MCKLCSQAGGAQRSAEGARTLAAQHPTVAPLSAASDAARARSLREELRKKLSLYREALLEVRCESDAALEDAVKLLVSSAPGVIGTALRCRLDEGVADVLFRKADGGVSVELRIAVVGNVRAAPRSGGWAAECVWSRAASALGGVATLRTCARGAA